ncbi:UNVERIFIED_CONTAM: hypothetical protein Slati_0818700 [Sesamum latifolium]|uniref:Uncharacterized protein n=1 Tax=Sesamum latifolium TaxID=2727402 RepID=A0AAW2XLC0_9LAMI
MRKFLWKGGTDSGMAKVAWRDICRPLEEGGQGIRALEPLNRGLMCRHLWDTLQKNDESIWVIWIRTYRLKNNMVWTANPNSGSWCWRKILRLRGPVLNCIRYDVGPGSERMVWKDPWHPLGVLIHRFPWGPQICGISIDERLSVVMQNGEWAWPEILNIEHREITDMLPQIGQTDAVHWTFSIGFTTAEAYRLFHPPGPKVVALFIFGTISYCM